MPTLLLTAHDCVGHVHLVIGSNSIANARCAKSLEVGANPIVIAPRDAEVHYALKDKIDAGHVQRCTAAFHDEDLTRWGRDEVDNIVDAVFVTLGGKESMGMLVKQCLTRKQAYTTTSSHTYAYIDTL